MTNDECRKSEPVAVTDALERFLFMAIKSVQSKGMGEAADVTFQATASTDSIDRHGDRIKPEAFDETAKPFLRTNPVLLAAHMHRAPDGSPTVIGSVTDLVIQGTRVEMSGVITGATQLGREWGALVRDKHVRAVSIGFIPLASDFDGEVLPGKTVEVFTRIELLEISLVAVPANAEALIRARHPHALMPRPLDADEAERFRATWKDRADSRPPLEILWPDPGFDGRFKDLEAALKQHLNEQVGELADRIVDRLVAAGILEDHEANALHDGCGGDGETRGVGTGGDHDDEMVGPAFESREIRAACAKIADVAHDTRK